MERCVNIDWLEVFASEGFGRDYSPDGFRRRGYYVEQRPYGTKQMEQVFTVFDKHYEPMLEIRRAPRGIEVGKKTVYSLGDCYIRLVNAYCYHQSPVGVLCEFLEREGYALRRIYRIDLCLDFVRFDSGDYPEKVVRRIVSHVYSKVNQCTRRVNGTDTWTHCEDNWISWGAPKSMISTKFYNKSKEIRDTNFHKPWILHQWLQAGFIDNPAGISLAGETVDVWRLEFSIKSSAKEWVLVSKNEAYDGEKHFLPHSLDLYADKAGIWTAIRNLIPYYFHFKIYEEGKRKSRCRDKVLFRFDDEDTAPSFRLQNESDSRRLRPDEEQNVLNAIRQLSAIRGRLDGYEASAFISQAVGSLHNVLSSGRETYLMALMTMNGNRELAKQLVNDKEIF